MTPAAPFPALVRLSALEAVRRPVFLLVALSSIAGIVLLPFLLNYTLGDAPRILRDSALALALVAGLFLAAHAAAEGLARELRRGTAAAVLSKPVPRGLYLLARAAGIAAALILYGVAALAATLLAVRAGASEFQLDWAAAGPALLALLLAPACAGAWNRRTRRPFTSAAFFLLLAFLLLAVAAAAAFPTPFDHRAFPANFSWNILAVGGLLILCLVMTAAFATALATRLAAVPVILLTAAVFALGLMADYLFGPHLDSSWAARAAYAALPNLQAFWLVDALDAATPIPPAYFAGAAAYAAAWSAAVLALGAASFHLREIT